MTDFKVHGISYPLKRLPTLGEGHCFIHAILQATYREYRRSCNHRRIKLVKDYRRGLARRLSQVYDQYPEYAAVVVDNIGPGELSFDKKSLMRHLASDDYLGEELIRFVSDQLDKDIYLLDLETHDIKAVGWDPATLYRGRPSIIIVYTIEHYETVAVFSQSTGQYETILSPDHPLIIELRSRVST